MESVFVVFTRYPKPYIKGHTEFRFYRVCCMLFLLTNRFVVQHLWGCEGFHERRLGGIFTSVLADSVFNEMISELLNVCVLRNCLFYFSGRVPQNYCRFISRLSSAVLQDRVRLWFVIKPVKLSPIETRGKETGCSISLLQQIVILPHAKPRESPKWQIS